METPDATNFPTCAAFARLSFERSWKTRAAAFALLAIACSLVFCYLRFPSALGSHFDEKTFAKLCTGQSLAFAESEVGCPPGNYALYTEEYISLRDDTSNKVLSSRPGTDAGWRTWSNDNCSIAIYLDGNGEILVAEIDYPVPPRSFAMKVRRAVHEMLP
jgi:hypothetical protein